MRGGALLHVFLGLQAEHRVHPCDASQGSKEGKGEMEGDSPVQPQGGRKTHCATK